jgi:hypothetical protein
MVTSKKVVTGTWSGFGWTFRGKRSENISPHFTNEVIAGILKSSKASHLKDADYTFPARNIHAFVFSVEIAVSSIPPPFFSH